MADVSDVLRAGEFSLQLQRDSDQAAVVIAIRSGADGNSPCAEEPDEGKALMSGSVVAVGRATALPTITGSSIVATAAGWALTADR